MQRKTNDTSRWALVLGMLVAPWYAVADEPYTIQTDVPVPMSDGIALAGDLYLPTEGEKFPTVLVRTPYNKRGKTWLGRPLASNGYAVFVQDVRGMNASQGQFIPFLYEKKDGIETLDWIAQQPWCDSNVGMWGTSYVAYCALVVAPNQHPALKTVVNLSGWGDTYAMTTPGGAMHLMVGLPWTLSGQIRGKGSFHDFDWPEVFRRVPVVDIPTTLGIDSATWKGAVAMFADEELLDGISVVGQYARIDVPILHLTGWNDFVGRHTLDVYEGIDNAARAGSGPFQKLIVGPWRHDQIWRDETHVGDEDFGEASRMGVEKVLGLSTRWFDRWLKGDKNGVTREKPVRLFVMGENQWREFTEWPPRHVDYQKWHFDSDGAANTASGDGRLAREKSNAAPSDTFVFDPMNPVPTVGGANFHFFLDNLGIKDQRTVERREDVLVYTSAPLRKDLTLIGPLKAVIYASTEGRHTDFTAKLVEVRADGYARIIEDGIRRGPDPIGGEAVDAMKPGKVYRFTIDLGATGIQIPKGHRLRVEVSSSNFPKYTRNPNTGEPAEQATEFKTVTQTLYHSRQYSSHVLLPVLD
jgi:putative CocE/NonD family hydrolase